MRITLQAIVPLPHPTVSLPSLPTRLVTDAPYDASCAKAGDARAGDAPRFCDSLSTLPDHSGLL